MRGLLVAKGEEVAELGLGADRLELTKGNQTATPFPILPGFWPHISVYNQLFKCKYSVTEIFLFHYVELKSCT